jgi:hypothetical protein
MKAVQVLRNDRGEIFQVKVAFNCNAGAKLFVYNLWYWVQGDMSPLSELKEAGKELTNRGLNYRTTIDHRDQVCIRSHGWTVAEDVMELTPKVLEFLRLETWQLDLS